MAETEYTDIERQTMNQKLIASSFVLLLLTGCNKPITPTEAELEENKKIERQKDFNKNLAIAKDPHVSTIDRLRALDKVADIDEKLATQIRKPILDEIDKKIATQKKIDAALQKENEKRLKAEKRKKKQQGVSIGMSMQDVLDSSWGRPQHKTTYHSSMGELTIWQYGEYGERGSISFQNGIITMIQN